ncbi:AraC family transcriptional regulator [Loigolactobacillus coryniformis]|uniref:AraC family transcriptional regulator n=1 Tax=Loigolactobacillus coryniformis subsp. coryniformis KCTC 3167 = DSM 20001 TaxID=913848 RepID=A0A0R1FAM5_9LACO|nr:helix-turn-helix domain-containing protein [Loigolactobacillus coryniformis]ATO54965.1 AraC family transcriptional regulator [Loigolactobacillus coryniformis subsp. coryniformis KCTC 3167 = DSM 20001]KRK16372.1 AraC family transcriptional regulator [Loigolactobacillus coryniformis subsp. coryniformis KCTC 3167 = DSM 20001]
MKQSILDLLKEPTLIEQEQKNSDIFHDDIPTSAINTGLSATRHIPVLNNYFFRNKDIYISKHNRYAPYPTHTHTFLEMNYMLSGKADEIINGKKVHLKAGDLVLLDVGSQHSIGYLGDNDILINLLFRDQNISINLLNDLRRNKSILYEFLINRVTNKDGDPQNNYLIFHKQAENSEVRVTLDTIIEEYFSNREFSDSIIKSYLSILLTQLVRNYTIQTKQASSSQQLMIKILRDIIQNYQNITLDKIARKYNYNKNYLSNIFKQEVGKTFSEALTQERMIQAHTLITSTTLPITDIIEKVGISNKNFFYDKYKKQYHIMPSAARKQASK